ncbi:LIM and senescent cell antigen-like-containing domain protein 2, partial [Saccoglossus kowalevskii]
MTLGSEDTEPGKMSVPHAVCSRCNEGFIVEEKMINCNGELWHERCFVCAQCFRPFPDGMFFEFEGRKYCEHDFHVLFAPCCGRCGEFVIGRVIRAMNMSWHPDCFMCQLCGTILSDTGFVKSRNSDELTSDAREVRGELYCLRCHDKMGIPICGACRRPIEERVVHALGKTWHVE